MAVLQSGSVPATLAEVDAELLSLRTNVVPRAEGYVIASVTGTIAAALAANAAVFAMRLDPGSARIAYIQRIVVDFVTIVAFTVPITAGRRLVLRRGSGAAATGGTAIATVGNKRSDNSLSEFNSAQGGDVRISTTAALGVAGITFETEDLGTLGLVGQGTAGATKVSEFEGYDTAQGNPIIVRAGELLAIRNGPNAMDAAGTWQINVAVHYYEALT